MKNVPAKTKLLFLPLLLLAIAFITGYCFLYWLCCIRLDVVPLRQDMVHFWIPIGLSFLCILLFIRPRIHVLNLDYNNGKIRGLYYMVGAAVFCIPTVILVKYLDSATGKLTPLQSITEIRQKPATKYYKPNAYVMHKSFTGVEGVVSYSGKNNQYLNLDIYIAMPFTGDLYDTLQSPSAFLQVKYHKQISSKISDAEREAQWESFWAQSFESFDKDRITFEYLERMSNTADRTNTIIAAKKSSLYKSGAPVVILEPINEPFDQRNGNKMAAAALSFSIGLAVWLIMILIPGLHQQKLEKYKHTNSGYLQKQLYQTYDAFKPKAGFIATPLLLFLNLLVFIIMVFQGLGFDTFYTRDLIAWGAIYRPLVQQGAWWRLVTSMFLHGGIMHLMMNMFSLYLCGIFLEKIVGSKKFIAGYLVAGIAAAIASLWWHDKPVVAVGASGAIFGLYGILLSLIMAKMFDAALNRVLLVLLCCTAGYSLIMGFLSEGIDNSAHIGGLIAGCITGAVYAKLMLEKEPEQAVF